MPVNLANTYRDRQKAYVNAMGIKEGDRVMITHQCPNHAAGWGESWYLGVPVGAEVEYMEFCNGRGLMCRTLDRQTQFMVPYFVVVPVAPPRALTSSYAIIDGEEVELPKFALEYLQENVLCRK